MKLINVLEMIDRREVPPLTYKRKSPFTQITDSDLRSDISDRVTLCFMAEDETWIELPVNHPMLIPFYDCECYAIEGYDRGIKAWLEYEDYIEDLLSDWWEKHPDYERNKND